jgi:hypothetical protein
MPDQHKPSLTLGFEKPSKDRAESPGPQRTVRDGPSLVRLGIAGGAASHGDFEDVLEVVDGLGPLV